MPLSPASRVNYFDRQFIRLAELRDEQAYHMQQRRRHNLSHHSWGIVLGLEVLVEDGVPVVRPGLAVDGYGRELLLLDREQVGRAQFDRIGASRLDLWLEYRLDIDGSAAAPGACDPANPRPGYRAVERADVVVTRGGALPDPRRPPGVPTTALEEPLLDTPDDPVRRWPVYLGRITMDLPATGDPVFTMNTDDRVYVGLNAELIDHPGSASRIELGRRPAKNDTRQVGDATCTYAGNATRDFAVFAPASGDAPLEPTLAVYGSTTQLRGATEVHGNLALDGGALQFPDAGSGPADTGGLPSLYRSGDELRFDLGTLAGGARTLAIGTTSDGVFTPALAVHVDSAGAGATPRASVTVYGNLHVDGAIDADDVRTRTVSEDVVALLSGMVQATIASGNV